MFSDGEKARIRHFLAYPSWSAMSGSIQLGYPAASQPLYLVEDAFKRMLPGGEETIRRDLCECEAIESQISEARKRFKATALGDLKTNPEEMSMLRQELDRWVRTLASDLGVSSNPFAESNAAGGAGGINARVIG
jgi:hypothetical protein